MGALKSANSPVPSPDGTTLRLDYLYFGRLAVFSTLYAAMAHLGLRFAVLSDVATLVWPPSGLALAAIFVYGYRHWPIVVLGMAMTAFFMPTPLLLDVLATVGNTAEALVGVYLLRRFKVDPQLSTARSLFHFFVMGALVSASVGATGGMLGLAATSLPLGRELDLGSVWLVWWLGDVMGILIVGPAVMALLGSAPKGVWNLRRLLEAVLLAGALLAVSLLVFVEPSLSHGARYPLGFLLAPLLMWAAFRFELRGASLSVLLVVVVAIRGTAHSIGPFSGEGLQASLSLLWAFMAVVATVTLVFTALTMERRRADGEREVLQHQLQQIQKMEAIGQLTGGIAHDFNNILGSVLGFAELAEYKLKASGCDQREPALARYLGQVQEAGRRARDLVGQLMAFSRGGGAEDVPLDLASNVTEGLRLLRSTMPATVALETEFCDEPLVVLGEPVKVQQLVMNLCLNARDAMDGRGRITVGLRRSTVAARRCSSCFREFSGEFVELEVSDTGRGIVADVLERIFEPFYTSNDHGEGSGMGLAVVHGIVHGAGGHVLVHSQPGEGTRMRIFLPCVDGMSKPQAPRQSKTLPVHQGVGRVLVVEDDVSLQTCLKEMLESCGFEVKAFGAPGAALREFETRPLSFDVVVTDQTMPGFTGVDLAAKLRSVRPDLPVILCSGYHDALVAEDVAAAGVYGVCRKPVDGEELIQLVLAALG